MTFDKSKHLIRVQGNRAYLPVAARILWFRQEHPDWSVDTEFVTLDHEHGLAICRAFVRNGEGRIIATATSRETAKGFADFMEKAETASIGRALGFCGFGTDASPDLDDGRRDEAVEDSPSPDVTPSQDRGPQGYREGGRTGRNFGGRA